MLLSLPALLLHLVGQGLLDELDEAVRLDAEAHAWLGGEVGVVGRRGRQLALAVRARALTLPRKIKNKMDCQ